MKLHKLIIIFCVVLGCYIDSDAMGGEFKMSTFNKGTWKGIVPVSFKGKITSSTTGATIKTFTVCEIINGTPHSGQLVSEGRTIDLGPQTIETRNGNYGFILYIATLNGQIHSRSRLLGLPSEITVLQISATGYENKNISIARDKIVVGEDNNLDINLGPVK